MQNVNKYHSLGDRLGVVRLALGSTKRRLQSADAALGVKLLNVPLAELAIVRLPLASSGPMRFCFHSRQDLRWLLFSNISDTDGAVWCVVVW